MKTEEIVDAARNAGFSSSEITHRLAAFKRLIQYSTSAEREKCTGTQEFVTLPREVVRQALAYVEQHPVIGGLAVRDALRAAFEQPPTVKQSLIVQPQGEQEPVSGVVIDGSMGVPALVKLGSEDAHIQKFGGQRLYTRQPPALEQPQPKREPLTDKQISRLWSDAHNDTTDRMAFQVLARAVEAAHNIK